jgi:hypothetical protein
MPPCRKDSKRHYTGDEPSPKGYGFCAHNERIGTVKQGNHDPSKLYIVKPDKNGRKSWKVWSGADTTSVRSTPRAKKSAAAKKRVATKKGSARGSSGSPSKRGYAPGEQKIGQRRKGTDGNMWVVKRSGERKRWSRVVTVSR